MLSEPLESHSTVPILAAAREGTRAQNAHPGHPSTAWSRGLDHDQQLSRLLTDGDPPRARGAIQRSASLATASMTPVSPAAMFLNAFSPSVSSTAPIRHALEDDEGEVVAGYTLGPILGSGGFSTIRLASSSSGGNVAIKIVRRFVIDSHHTGSDPNAAFLAREARIWATLRHEHILPLFSTCHTDYADYFVMLYCPAGTLYDILKRDGNPGLSSADVGTLFRQVASGLGYLHGPANLVHGDLKLENVLVDEMGMCRITDFGLARQVGAPCEEDSCYAEMALAYDEDALQEHNQVRGGRMGLWGGTLHLSMLRPHGGGRHRPSLPMHSNHKTRPTRHFAPGSLPYASPEMLSPTNMCSCTVQPAQDIWALGVLLYTLLAGRLPFWDAYEPRLQFKILNGEYKAMEHIGAAAENVLKGCLDKDISTRWSIEMVDDVAHNVGWGPSSPDVTQAPTPMRRPSHSPDYRRRSSRSSSRHPLLSPEGRSSSRSNGHGLPSAVVLERTVSISTSPYSGTPPLLTTSSVGSEDRGRRSTRRPLDASAPHSRSESLVGNASPDLVVQQKPEAMVTSPVHSSPCNPELSLSPPPLARSSSASSSSSSSTSAGLDTPKRDRDISLPRGRKALRGNATVLGLDVLDETARWTPSLSPGPHRFGVSKNLGELIQRDRAHGREHQRQDSEGSGAVEGMSSWFFIGAGADAGSKNTKSRSTSRGPQPT